MDNLSMHNTHKLPYVDNATTPLPDTEQLGTTAYADNTVTHVMSQAPHGLPDGVTLNHVVAVLIPVFLVTLALRALPFAALHKIRDSAIVAWLGITMPIGVMVILVLYAVHERRADPGGYLAVAAALVFTIVLHLWRKSATLSILLGTAFYALLINVIL